MISKTDGMGVILTPLIFTGTNSPLRMIWEQETSGRKGICPISGVCHMLVTGWMGSLRFGSENQGEPFNMFALDVIGRS